MKAKMNNQPRPDAEPEDEFLPGEAAADEDRRSSEAEEEDIEILRVDPADDENDVYDPDGTSELDLNTVDADINAEQVMAQIGHYSDDEDVLEDFSERQRIVNEGSDELLEKIQRNNAMSPDLSGDDIDAAWEDSIVAGEESVGGSSPTPDQDVVDELGEALGFTYQDHEPLHTEEKLEARDLNRWELNPVSAEDLEEQADELEDLEDEEMVEEFLEDELELDDLEDIDSEDDIEAEELEDDDLGEEDFDDFELDEDDLDDLLDDLHDDEEDE